MAKIKVIIPILISILIPLLMSIFIQKWISQDQIRFTQWLASYGNYVILVYIPLQAITLIIAPLGGFFLMIAMINLFGPGIAITLMYLISVPCYTINFLISKKYGRPLVEKIVGHEPLAKIDHYVNGAGMLALIALRLFHGGSFDYLSYGFGLTKTKLRDFFLVNAIAGLGSSYVFYAIFKYSKDINAGIIT